MFCSKCGDKIDKDEKFCNKCGNPLTTENNLVQNVNSLQNITNDFNNTNNFKTSKITNKKMIIIGVVIGVFIILVLFLVVYFFGGFSDSYYFNEKSTSESEKVEQTSSKKNKYSTVIISDNTYTGVKIDGKKDANSLIIKDSVEQKDNCPSEMKKVENEIIEEYGITAVNLCEMNIDFARELKNVFENIYTEYPTVKGYFTNLTLVNASIKENYIAAFMPAFPFATADTKSTYPWVIKTQMLLNTSYFLNVERLEASVTGGSESGHFPKNATIYSPVAHEMGHYLSFIAMMKHHGIDSVLLIKNKDVNDFYELTSDFAEGKYSLTMINEAYENYKKDTNATISLDEFRAGISNYAVAKDNSGNYIYDETIAEAFHDTYLNGNNANVASKYIVSVLKEKLGS